MIMTTEIPMFYFAGERSPKKLVRTSSWHDTSSFDCCDLVSIERRAVEEQELEPPVCRHLRRKLPETRISWYGCFGNLIRHLELWNSD